MELDGAYHCDGGLRQNVPLSPARRLGAARVLVVNPRYISTAPLDDRAAEDLFPGPLFLLGKTLNALLLDRIDTDLARLETINHILAAGARVAGPGFVDGAQPRDGLPRGRRACARCTRSWCAPREDIGRDGRRLRARAPPSPASAGWPAG